VTWPAAKFTDEDVREDDGTIRKGGSIWGSVSKGCPDHESLKKAAAVLAFFGPDYFGN